MTPKTYVLSLLATAMIAPAIRQASAATPNPLLEYNFNDSSAGNSTSSTGSIDYDLDFYDSAANPEDLRGGAGSGVSGESWDYAFDNTASTGMGTSGVGGRAQGSENFTGLGGLQSFTITGWINPSTQIDNSPNILNNFSEDSGVLVSGNNGRLSINVNGTGVVSSSSGFSGTNTWYFFAISYDGTAASGNNVSFYTGGTDSAASLDIQRSVIAGAVIDPEFALTVGNLYEIRPFDGLMDNFAIYGSYDDDSGALSATDIESIRQAASIPEVSFSSTIMGLMAIFGIFGFRRLSRK